MSLFADFEDWTIAIFDNILVLCNDYADGMEKLSKVIDRCYERGVVLKFSKSWIGFRQVKFFGYIVTPGKSELDAERKQTVMDTTMPTGLKGMQRFLGVAVFFSEYVPDFASKTSLLYDMIRHDFNWDRKTWAKDYQGEFERVTLALCNSEQ